MGSVFSPYYARARASGNAPALDHCALNVALYGRAGKRWALTERGERAVHRSAGELVVGPSAVAWDGNALTIEFDETTFPLPSRLAGTVRVHPVGLADHAVTLDTQGRHRWAPLAARARVEVSLRHPALTWSGTGYLDTNEGDEPLDRAFARWHWSRAQTPDGTIILYDIERRQGEDLAFALRCDQHGRPEVLPPPPGAPLRPSAWRIARHTLADRAAQPRVLASLEDTPFYARSLVETRLIGAEAVAVHESLSLDRFRQAWVQLLLPFRMPRRAGSANSGQPGR